MRKISYIVVVSLIVLSCRFFKTSDDSDIIARVNEDYLYLNDIKDIVPKDASKADSAFIVNTYVNRWASQLLLMDGAIQNLSEEKQEEFSKLVEQYKTDLYTKAYLEALVNKTLDSTVSKEDALNTYNSNKESFKLNDDLIQFRYIALANNSKDIDTVKKRLQRFKEKDRRYLDSISVQFKSFMLNDSLWVTLSHVSKKLPVVTEQKSQLLKKSNFLQLKDSLNIYLMHVKDVRFQNNYAPLAYVNSTIQQIVINKRKLELIKKLEKDITKDAIKKKQFQIYK